MRLSIIAAMAQNRVIGRGNALPWRLPEDLKWFRSQTLGKPIIMGRKTFESIGSKALPGRKNIVLSRSGDLRASDVIIAGSLQEALAHCPDAAEVMIIGGARLYAQTLALAQRLYLTLIHKAVEGDAYFPKVNWDAWQEVERHDHLSQGEEAFAYSFLILDKKDPTTQ